MTKGLGVGFEDMENVMIDTDTGQIVTGELVTPEASREEIEEKHDLIEVEVDDGKQTHTKPKISSDAEGAPSSDHNSSSSSLPFKVLVTALHEKGVLTQLDESVFDNKDADQAETLISLLRGEIESNVASYKNSLPAVVRKIIENYEENVPLDQILKITNDEIKYNKLDVDSIKEDEALQEQIVTDSLRREGMDEKRITRMVKSLKEADQLEEEALSSFEKTNESLKAEEENAKKLAKQNAENYEKQRIESLNALKKDIYDTTNIIDGIPLTERDKKKIFESMTTAVDKDQNGNPMNGVMVTRSKNPVGFEKLLHYYHSIGLFDIDKDGNPRPNFTTIKTGAKSSAIDELSSALKAGQSLSAGQPARELTRDKEAMKRNIESMKGLV